MQEVLNIMSSRLGEMDTQTMFGFVVSVALMLSVAVHCQGPPQMIYSINNQLEDPYFQESIELDISPQKNLIYYMEQAVLQDPAHFTNFTATFTSPYGYFIDSINGLAGNWAANQTYWQILNQDGPLSVGVSTYVPKKDDNILFNFTTGDF